MRKLRYLAVLSAAVKAMLVMPTAALASVAPTAPMGINLWYVKGCAVTEADVLAQANAMHSDGLEAAGYQYVNLDDCWMSPSRLSNGQLTWNVSLFPHGIPYLAQQVHALGLKFGLYESVGPTTCARNSAGVAYLPGSGSTTGTGPNHYAQDAQTFASWHVDFVKFDNCGYGHTNITYATLKADFAAFGADWAAANPNGVYSQELPICCIGTSGYNQSIADSAAMANMWRIWWDEKAADGAAKTIFDRLNADRHLHGYASPGHWNDMDMILAGVPVFGWSQADEQSQLSVWAMEASPLLLSTDLTMITAARARHHINFTTTLTHAELSALGNRYMIAIDQSGMQSPKSTVSDNSSACEEFQKPYPGGGVAVLLDNQSSSPAVCEFALADFGLTSTTATLFNVWTGTSTVVDHVGDTLGANSTALLRLS